MGSFIDMTGWKMWEHGVKNSRLIIIRRAEDRIRPNGKRDVMWEYKCNCGNEQFFIDSANHIRTGHTFK